VDVGDSCRPRWGLPYEVEQLAVRAKNTALAWVYIIEWVSVTAASLFSAAILWTLMVRRTMYRETAMTRGRRGDQPLKVVGVPRPRHADAIWA